MSWPAEPGTAEAVLLDGRTATRHRARLRLAPPLLWIEPPDAAPIAWNLAQLGIVAGGPGAGGLRLAPADRTDPARLDVTDAAMAATLRTAIAAARPRRPRAPLVVALAAGALVSATALAGLWHAAPDIADRTAALLPQRALEVLGEAALHKLSRGAPACQDAAAQAAIAALAGPLAAAAGLPAPSVTIIDLRDANAFALPGGRIAVTSGLLRRMQDPAELAGVLAHEIAHLRHNHPARGLVRAIGIGGAVTILTGGSDIAGLVAVFVTLSGTRAFEREADATAVHLLTETGLGTEGLRRFLATADQARPGRQLPLEGYLSTHPGIDERLAALPQVASSRPALDPPAWQALREACPSRP